MSSPPNSPSRRAARQGTHRATAILVLGMHRSGTSAVARMLNLRGADLGRDLLPPKQDNERGFWENRALLALHERFLADAGLHWHDLASLPEDWRNAPAARRFVSALPDVLAQQFNDSDLFLVKDPRLSLLAPLWIEVLEARAVRPVFVITIRHPDEVAASLAARDGFSRGRSRLLWLQHLLEAERATRGHRRIFVNYECVLADWRAELARIAGVLGIAWPREGADADRQIDAFIAPSLRHHHKDDAATSADASTADTVQQAYRIASAAGADQASASAEAFDDLHAAFDIALSLAGPVIADLSGQLAQARAQHAREIEHARATIDGFAAEIAQAREAHESRDRVEAELRDALASKADEIGRARANIDALAGELSRAREGFAAKDREIAAARDNIDALSADLARIIDELAQARAAIASKDREIDDARHLIEAKDAELDAARGNIGVLEGQIEQARAGFAAKDAEIGVARTNIDALVAEIARAREAHAARDAADAMLRESRWFRLGRALRLIGRDRP